MRFLEFLNLVNGLESFSFLEISWVFIYGLGHDMRTLSAAFLPILLCGFLSYLGYFVKLGLKDKIFKVYKIFSCAYIALLGVLVAIFSFINYFYYKVYQNRIDMFIFGLKDDETKELIYFIWQNYPVALGLICALALALICIYINIRILRLKMWNPKFKIPTLILLNLLLLYAYAVALRGHPIYNALRAQTYTFSTFKPFNDISTNPIMALSWASKEYKIQASFREVSLSRGAELESRLFPLYQTSVKNQNAKKPHIHLNIMESFGLAILDNNKELESLLLGDLYKHFNSDFKEDFVFKRFLPGGDGTIGSLNRILFISPIFMTNSKFQNKRLLETPLEVYKNAGYKIIFIYPGNASWYNLGNYLKAQGVEFIDEVILLEQFPQARASKHPWGIKDEFMYEKVYEVLEAAVEPTLVISLSISNHPPHIHKSNNDFSNIKDEAYLKRFSDNYKDVLGVYSYAADTFGKYLDKVKQSDFKDNLIIAATGDHQNREYNVASEYGLGFHYNVPLYLYIPQNLQQNIHYDKNRIGSHKDIFPTLYALTLSEVEFLSMCGKNMLGIPQDLCEFGVNKHVWIDKNGIYQRGASVGYRYGDSLKKGESFMLDDKSKEFLELYEELEYYQLAKRLGLAK